MGWMQTLSGKHFYPTDPHPSDIDINDIAHSLSNLCRFAGHCKDFYSVAQHSVLVAQYLKSVNASTACVYAGLMHDATEAYLIDLPRPVKELFPEYSKLEKGLMQVIFKVFNIKVTNTEWEMVKYADNVLLISEARDLMGDPKWEGFPEPLKQKVKSWSRAKAKREFLKMFSEYKIA